MPPLSKDQIEHARSANLLSLIGADTELRRIAAHEYAGPCPFCGGEDRFHVQPERGRWFCRQCTGEPGDSGWRDAIDYVRQRQHLSFPDAIAYLSGPVPLAPPRRPSPSPRPLRVVCAWQRLGWQLAAWADLLQAQRALAGDDGETGRLYLQERGFLPATWQAWGLGLAWRRHPQRRQRLPALLLPWRQGRRLTAVQHRFLAPDLAHRERYGQRAGGERLLFGLPLRRRRPTLLLVEGEFNALSLWQAAGGQADVLSWGPQGNLLRPPVLALAASLISSYHHLVVWADAAEVAEQGKEALLAALPAGACPSALALCSADGRDANDLLRCGELMAFLGPSLPSCSAG